MIYYALLYGNVVAKRSSVTELIWWSWFTTAIFAVFAAFCLNALDPGPVIWLKFSYNIARLTALVST